MHSKRPPTECFPLNHLGKLSLYPLPAVRHRRFAHDKLSASSSTVHLQADAVFHICLAAFHEMQRLFLFALDACQSFLSFHISNHAHDWYYS